ncbi:MAG: purine-nucleoside phosphorylase [Pirellulales bacterium]
MSGSQPLEPEQLVHPVVEAAAVLRRRWQYTPQVALILGSGLGELTAGLSFDGSVRYDQIPHFPPCSATGHAGVLRFGMARGVPLVVLQGRWHLYEGHPASAVALPIRSLWMWGVRTLITTCAAGGLNPQFACGDLVVVRDHLNLLGRNPLIGPQPTQFGPRWPDMSDPYDAGLRATALEIGRRHHLPIHEGTYAALTGPNYETRAEYRMLRRLGADLVGMSTVPEVLTAVPLGMKIFSLAVVTNVCRPDALGSTSGQQVIDAAERSMPNVRTLLYNLLDTIAESE